MSRSKGSILVIRGGDVREFVLTCPVFAALREQFPETSLEVLGYPRIAQLAKDAGLIDEIRSIETRAAAGFFGRNMSLDEELGNYFAGFQMIFSYLYDPDGHFQINVGRVSAAQFVQGPARPKEADNMHASHAFLKPLESLAIFGADSVPRLDFRRAKLSLASSWIAVSPGCPDDRNWPLARWNSLLRAIIEKTSYRIVLAAQELDGKSLEALARSLPAERLDIVREATLSEVGARFAACQGFVGPDSGLLQLAAATGIPCAAIWGNSNATLWRPPGKNVTLLRNRAGVNSITLEEVLAALPMVWSGAE